MLDGLRSDLRFGSRALRKSPAFTLVAVATLALGIGANTAIFSVVDNVLLRPLAYRDATRLYAVHEVVPRFAHLAPMIPVNAMHFGEWRRNTRAFEEMALVGGMSMSLTGRGDPERIPSARVSPALFRMLGVKAVLGRTFTDSEDQPGKDDVVVLDHALWTRRFGNDPGVIGRSVTLDGRPYRVIGVLPQGFRFPKLSQLYELTVAEQRRLLWKPFAVAPTELEPLGDFNFACIVALKTGIGLAEGVGQLDGVLASLMKSFPEPVEVRTALVPLQDQITGRSRRGLVLLLGSVALVLLIGCANIANLLLARATGRRRELAVRVALGANRRRLTQQMLVESLGTRLGRRTLGRRHRVCRCAVDREPAPVDLPRLDEVHVDARVLLFTIALSLAAGLVSGLVPAWRAARTDPQDAMQASARGAIGTARGGRTRNLLVGLEVALCAVCLAVGGLLLHSYARLLSVDAGFAPASLVTLDLELPKLRYPDTPQRAALLRSLLERIGSGPGVVSAGSSNQLPLAGEGGNNLIAPEGSTLRLVERPLADIRSVSRDYFKTMGIPLVSGRIFDDSDREHLVALVSSLVAAKVWPGQNAIGRRFRLGGDDTPLLTVAGVVGDVRGVALGRAPRMTVYRPYWQMSREDISIVVRTAGDARAAGASMAAAVHAIDPLLPVPMAKTMDDIVAQSVAQPRFQMTLVLFFAAVAALLASLGIYGVIAYAVAQRTSELGIRTALGASPQAILLMVVGQGLRPVAIGLAVGLGLSFVVGRAASSLLYDVSTYESADACWRGRCHRTRVARRSTRSSSSRHAIRIRSRLCDRSSHRGTRRIASAGVLRALTEVL